MKTYTMYVREDEEDPTSFEPVMCLDDIDAMRKARALLSSRAGATAVDVYFGDVLVVTVGSE
jgi:hypothetical protein